MACSLLHIPWRLIRTAIVVLLTGLVLFFALTRTQVGRNELRQELQRQFDDRFAGTLSIGSLQGNLVNDLFASDIQVRDPAGRTVLSIDSLVARPRWLSLFDQQLAFRSVTAIAPSAFLHRMDEGDWSLQRAFARRLRADTSSTSLAFSLADLHVRDGSVMSTRSGPAPRLVDTDWLFDYTQAHLDSLQIHATVEWQSGNELIDIFELSGALPSRDVRLRQLQGQMLGTPTGWAFNQISVQTENTDLTFDASLPRWEARPAPANPETAPPPMVLDIASSTLDFDEIRRIVPRLPLRDAATVEAEISGPLSGLVVEALRIERGASQVELAGTITDLPERLDYELDLSGAPLLQEDILAVVPTAPIARFDSLGAVTLSLYGTGLIPFRSDTLTARTRTAFEMQSAAGALAGTVDVTHRPDVPLTYSGRLRSDSLNLQPFVRRPEATSALTGTARFEGQGFSRTSSSGSLDLSLAPSTLAGRRLDSLSLALEANAGQFTSNLDLWHPSNGLLHAENTVDFSQPRATHTTTVSTERFDLSRLPLDGFPATQLTGRMETQGIGFSPEVAAGRLSIALDSSSVTYNGVAHTIPPHRSTITLADRNSSEPRLELTGDVAILQLRGDVAFEPLWALGNLWGRSLVAAARRELDKPYNPPLAAASPMAFTPEADRPPAPRSMPSIAQWRERARRALLQAGLSSDLAVETTFAVKRADVLEALLPFFPTLRTDLEGQIAVTAGADRMAVESHLSSTSFAVQGLSTDSLTVRLDAAGSLDAPLAETFSTELSLRGGQTRIGPVGLRAPELRVSYSDRQALLQFTSEENGRTGPLRLATSADLLFDRNELEVYDVHFTADSYTWSSVEPSTIDAYADALIIPDLQLESQHPEDDRVQRLRVHGTFSSAPSDTLVAEAEHVLLQPFSQLAQQQRPIGGLLNGTVALSGGWAAPRTTSTLNVDWLSFDRRLLGRLQAATRYELGTPDVHLDASLRPMETDSTLSAPDYLPYRPRRTERNHIDLSGRVRLFDPDPLADPLAAPRTDLQTDPLDLELTVERADLFFFEYIFQEQITNVSGYLTGTGQVRGSPRYPLFSANLQAVDGRFELPEFNLQYALDGPISVDGDGINLHQVDVHGPDDGQATVSGSVLFNEYAYFSFDLGATLEEMRIIDVASSQDLPFYGTISASGTASLTGPLDGATLRTDNAQTTPDSELYIPVKESEVNDDSGFLIFADSTGQIPDLQLFTQRENILDDRPEGEPSFLDALDLDINLQAPQGSTVHLVFDPLLGDVVTAVGSGRIQIQRQEGEFFTYGTLEVNAGEYLFTAGEVFVRRFRIDGGTITWDGNPTNAQLDLDASYRTRASTAGLSQNRQRQRIPVVIQLDITGRVASPRVGLSLAIDSRDRNPSFASEALQRLFNQPDLATDDLATEYATSVLLTNTFLLTTEAVTNRQQTTGDTGDRLTNAGNQLAFNSVSQLVASQLNRYLNEALPNLDVNLGVQGEDPQDLDLIYGVALRLLDERLVIRGEGVYQGNETERRRTEGLEGEFVVEIRLNRNVSVEAFYRRSGDALLNDQTLTSTTGAGLSYQTEFTTWRRFFQRLFNWFIPGRDAPPKPPDETPDEEPAPADSAAVLPRGSAPPSP